MHRLTPPQISLAMALSLLAGFVDALGFMQLSGHFVSFMSGNTTQWAVALVQGHFAVALGLALLVGVFLVGTMAGAALSLKLTPKRHKATVLMVMTALLITAATLAQMGFAPFALYLTAFVMGFENSMFQNEGEVTVGLTYMTGTLVKMGQNFVRALMGRSPAPWLSYLGLWCALLCGGLLGALAYLNMGVSALMIAALFTLMLGLWVHFKKGQA